MQSPLTTEVWRLHPEFDAYEVSSFGRVRRVEPYGSTYVGRVLRPGKDRDGYHRVVLSMAGRKKAYRKIHVLVLETFVGKRPEDCWGLHGDDDKSNNRLSNLRWAPRIENYADQVRNGRPRVGAANGKSKLAAGQVIEIKSLLRRGIKHREIANMYGVTRSCITCISRGITWGHI